MRPRAYYERQELEAITRRLNGDDQSKPPVGAWVELRRYQRAVRALETARGVTALALAQRDRERWYAIALAWATELRARVDQYAVDENKKLTFLKERS